MTRAIMAQYFIEVEHHRSGLKKGKPCPVPQKPVFNQILPWDTTDANDQSTFEAPEHLLYKKTPGSTGKGKNSQKVEPRSVAHSSKINVEVIKSKGLLREADTKHGRRSGSPISMPAKKRQTVDVCSSKEWRYIDDDEDPPELVTRGSVSSGAKGSIPTSKVNAARSISTEARSAQNPIDIESQSRIQRANPPPVDVSDISNPTIASATVEKKPAPRSPLEKARAAGETLYKDENGTLRSRDQLAMATQVLSDAEDSDPGFGDVHPGEEPARGAIILEVVGWKTLPAREFS
ncbi:hypothetical protein BJ875DRAFT_437866 [Amylocarpus encephaloides]|uniref:Uncharacterized protein n=1 Tax=Amylocarpus encephaloides TaxID=45428 RepID=A0A9P7YQP9_9HELO|nr:hypothetical protein BJ875DRAFT_437866 [Amylocarpus encephaloides]